MDAISAATRQLPLSESSFASYANGNPAVSTTLYPATSLTRACISSLLRLVDIHLNETSTNESSEPVSALSNLSITFMRTILCLSVLVISPWPVDRILEYATACCPSRVYSPASVIPDEYLPDRLICSARFLLKLFTSSSMTLTSTPPTASIILAIALKSTAT